ncbi:hypothetical protein [Dictyobacter kobayashii]|uniref:Uncharacterized protein n=1 Tax=Dictyobacter kobayashii TaxID=2014872 RepID=A0A402AMU7_9CHLR|nr:hypothetical protein [Dictyobacter kobayashii]GCE20369.1 hypothetical protein KDK_41690 [Dictyobacter kobayashii]
MNESIVRILGAFLDTLYLNVYQTDTNFQVVKKKLSDELKLELQQLKEQAQEDEENIPTRFSFDGKPLLMMMKGSEGFNWILKNESINFCVNRGSKMNLCAQVRCSSEYLWKRRDISAIVNEVFFFATQVFGQQICLQVSALDLAVDVINFQLPSAEDIKECFISRAQLSEEAPANLADCFVDGPDRIKRRWGGLLACRLVLVELLSLALSMIKRTRLNIILLKSPGSLISGVSLRVFKVLSIAKICRSCVMKCASGVRLCGK